jgi:uncharacterized protein (TIGR02145 family)
MVKSGESEFLMKSSSITNVSGGAALSVQGASPAVLNRQTKGKITINDVIAATKEGYLNYQVVVTNSDTSGIEIKMIVSAGTVTDADGNIYQTVRIGNQVWTVENLRTTRYNDGTPIPNITRNTTWDSCSFAKTGAYCYYKNLTNADSIKKYGSLYNWYAVNPTNSKKIAPSGWHVPDTTEWNTLQKYLIATGYNWDGTTDTTKDNKIAKSMAAKTDWWTYITTGTIGCDLTKNNSTGFAALPGGWRYAIGSFISIGYDGGWWCATEVDASSAYLRYLDYNLSRLDSDGGSKSCGFSVRLLRD